MASVSETWKHFEAIIVEERDALATIPDTVTKIEAKVEARRAASLSGGSRAPNTRP